MIFPRISYMARRKIIDKQNANGPWNEIIGLILIGIGIVLLLALVSYDSSDPSWNSVGGNTRAHNLIGPMGAKVADALYQALGIAALIVPLMLFLIGRWQWDDDESEVSKPKILGLFLMIVAFTGWVTLFGPDKPGSFYWGGFVGQWLIYGHMIGLARLLGGLGAFVALVILFTAGLLLGTDYTLIGLIDNWSRSRPDGAVAEWANRLRIKKQQREPQTVDVVQPGHVYAKFHQRKRANRPDSPVAGMRVTVRPGVPAGRKQSPSIIQSRQSEQEIGAEVGEPLEEAGGVVTAEEPLQVAESAPKSARGYYDSRERPARIPPSLVTGQRRSMSGDEDEHEDEPDRINEPSEPVDQGDGEYDMDDSTSQRTVDEMMATASVKRVEAVDAT